MVDCGPLPPRLDVHPELTDDDVTWLNQQLTLVDSPTVKYARALPPPPPSGAKPLPVTDWITTTTVRT